ncbi:cation diffusion facilitator family transporter [Paramicrobacterium agarici]|uniref:cation diffusion facilitator family transporter n=1 Tax=Paramicrobacterium agarici TaxID=630514 RepID=UPI00114D6F54|nr:cation diffusion facilitator family transporter [Microbacterium agarici]
MFVPHTHDPSNAVDDALEASVAGVKAVKVSMIALFITTVLQGIVVAFSGSVALLADTIHNFSDAFTAVPLWIAFALSRRAATRRYTYGFNRAEDLAGLCIVVMIALSAVLAAWQAIDRIINPQPIDYAGWVIAAGAIGFLGNEAVAIYRIRVGGKIGSAALVADGIHARTDGFTSLGVVLGGFGVLVGFPLADPIIGLLISAMIVVLLIGTVRSVGRRLMDGVEPELLDRVENAIGRVPAVTTIDRVRLRWVGHRLYGEAIVHIPDVSLLRANRIAIEVEDSVKQHLPNIDDMVIRTLAK